MKQFNLEEYLKNPSRKVVTRDGRSVTRFLCTDMKGDYPIVAVVESYNGNYQGVLTYTNDGTYYCNNTSKNDLFFAQEKHEGWVNLYRGALDVTYAGCVYTIEKEAREHIDDPQRYVATVKIEWEE